MKNQMTHASLFSGIGGFDLAAQWMGWENVFHCEWNPFCQAVLKYYWPNATTYNDITTTDFTIWRGRVDILSGGFPCQPFSTAGQRKGTSDDRYLWPEMLRAIREIAPSYIVGENVDGIFTWSDGMVFETVCADLENEGYEVATYRIPACATGAPHRRDRWWFVANTKSTGDIRNERSICKKDGRPVDELLSKFDKSNCGFTAHPNLRHRPETEIPTRRHQPTNGAELNINTTGERLERSQKARRSSSPTENGAGMEHRIAHADFDATDTRCSHAQNGLSRQQQTGQAKEHRNSIEGADRWSEHWVEAATRLCILDDGLSGRLDAAALSTKPKHAAGKWRKESLKAAGNAIVPQVAFEIFKAIKASNTQ